MVDHTILVLLEMKERENKQISCSKQLIAKFIYWSFTGELNTYMYLENSTFIKMCITNYDDILLLEEEELTIKISCMRYNRSAVYLKCTIPIGQIH